MSFGASLSRALPKPKYANVNNEPDAPQTKGVRVVAARELEELQVAVSRSGPPPYGHRKGWRPRGPEDFGDGGAFPEILVAQYPLEMGRKNTPSSSNALAVEVDAEGKVRYDAIARRGHSEGRIIHTSFKDLIPLRQRANIGEISFAKPSAEEVEATKERTQMALQGLVDGALAAQRPKNIKNTTRAAPTFVRYTPTSQMGDVAPKRERIMKIVQRQQDPMEPPKYRIKKIPRGPPSPPPPVMHSPPRKLTAADQEAWRIPPAISNWKNPKGYTIPLDKRLAADGRGLQDNTYNDKFAQFAEALEAADRHAREEVQQRALMQQKLAEREKEQKEEQLRELARRAREERTSRSPSRSSRSSRSSYSSSRSRSWSRSRSPSYSRSRSRTRTPPRRRSRSRNAVDEERRERERARQERRRIAQREMRQKNMGHQRRIQVMAREQNRDISEKVALGLAKPTQSREAMYDSRLFNQSSGFAAGFNEDQPYDKPLFADRDALNSIYRPGAGQDDDEDEGETMNRIKNAKRFEALGKAPKEGFRGSDVAQVRSGPVEFEAHREGKDPFGVDALIAEASGERGSGKRKMNDSAPSTILRECEPYSSSLGLQPESNFNLWYRDEKSILGFVTHKTVYAFFDTIGRNGLISLMELAGDVLGANKLIVALHKDSKQEAKDLVAWVGFELVIIGNAPTDRVFLEIEL
ncbi:hypothetical protein K470DRAFT_271286 [Piedraia hortae CBS 480.64]|uniref:Pre-mRNA-processing protein 45 n=1 Tax=Piedraia hortae CBS 480.64 TaxID=1314780 RepID=A0A6A7BX86_9PEZI|nr:hypothetical protein K470DRAFT_271286 [Piedraia hortae CBS 480.64]